ILRQKGEQELRKQIAIFLRERIRADQLRDIDYTILPTALELRGNATRPRNRVTAQLELLQNEIWDSGFDVRQYLLDNRSNRLLLPFVGEVTSSYRIRLEPETNPALPRSFELDCAPVRYALSFERKDSEVTVSEKISISDLLLQPDRFSKFTDFLNQYYAGHFWSILIAAI
ncbi:MAG TPA: hypothetical protein VJ521_13415, partial [Acidobacteriota bacterium]|nr:hypothetical protein [Acidobacteriota bacterium]